MILIPYTWTTPFAQWIAHFDGDSHLSLMHYSSAHSLVRVLSRPGLTRPTIATIHACLDALEVADPGAVTVREFYPEISPEIPEWLLLNLGDGEQDFILRIPPRPDSGPILLCPITSQDLQILRPIFDHPPTDGAELLHWMTQAERSAYSIMQSLIDQESESARK